MHVSSRALNGPLPRGARPPGRGRSRHPLGGGAAAHSRGEHARADFGDRAPKGAVTPATLAEAGAHLGTVHVLNDEHGLIPAPHVGPAPRRAGRSLPAAPWDAQRGGPTIRGEVQGAPRRGPPSAGTAKAASIASTFATRGHQSGNGSSPQMTSPLTAWRMAG